MSKSVLALTHTIAAIAAWALIGVVAAQAAEANSIVVTLDRARIVKVPTGTQTLIIGNPLVADVTMRKNNGSMVVIVRSFGTTNLNSLDASGNAIDETTIKVTPGAQSLDAIRGTAQVSYSFNPR